MKVRFAFLSICLAICLVGCLGGGNSGSETTNGLTGIIRGQDDQPVAGARVILLTEDYNGAQPEGQAVAVETRTDRSGAYSFREIRPGTYNLEVSDSATGTMAWIPGVFIAADVRKTKADGVLDTPGTVEVPLPDWVKESKPGYLFVPGTTEYVRVDSAVRAEQEVILGPLAPGSYPSIQLVVEENVGAPVMVAEEIEVRAGEQTVVAPFATWSHSRRVDLDPKGAGQASGSFRDYPVLLRISSGTASGLGAVNGFPFSEAAAGGRDLRASSGGKVLPLQVESWDAASGRATVWVRLDSLAWDASGQGLTLHWGRPGAPEVSSGPAVFSGGASFASVWHLAEPGNEDPGGYRDATSFANHATASGINKTPHLEGVAGMGKAFAGDLGTLSAKVPKGLGGNAGFTVTFWMKAAMQPGGRTSIIHFGAPANLAGFHFLIRGDTASQFGAHEVNPQKTAGDVAPWQNVFGLAPYMGQWTMVALTYDPAARKTTTWMNGVKADEDDMAAEGLALDAQGGFRIGRSLGGSTMEFPFDGILDEIRVHAAVLSESRLRLDYETQKP